MNAKKLKIKQIKSNSNDPNSYDIFISKSSLFGQLINEVK